MLLQNGQTPLNPYPGQTDVVQVEEEAWRSYGADAPEISYKGRWDSKFVSC